MIKTWPFSAGVCRLDPWLGAKISHALWPKNQNININSIVKTSIKTLKMVHIKKNLYRWILMSIPKGSLKNILK